MSISVLPSITDMHLNTINGVLGNVSQSGLNELSSPQQKVQAHLQYVLNILESGQLAPTNLTASQKQNRSECINTLRVYTNAGMFPHQFEYPDPSSTHRPCFKDDAGNVCAVGHLIEKTAGMEVVDRINTLFKFAYIRDMDLLFLEVWRNEYGFALVELAMIQPSYSFRNQRPISTPAPRYGIGPTVHTNVRCDVCEVSPITGVRYKCVNCPNFDMCANCESTESHDKTHVCLKLRYPINVEPSNHSALLPNVTVAGPQQPVIHKPTPPYAQPHRTD